MSNLPVFNLLKPSTTCMGGLRELKNLKIVTKVNAINKRYDDYFQLMAAFDSLL
jgi:hypothetical protein